MPKKKRNDWPFAIGDIVEYSGKSTFKHRQHEAGETGIVTGRSDYIGNYHVKWDSGKRDPGYHYSDLRLASPATMDDTRDYLEAVT